MIVNYVTTCKHHPLVNEVGVPVVNVVITTLLHLHIVIATVIIILSIATHTQTTHFSYISIAN